MKTAWVKQRAFVILGGSVLAEWERDLFCSFVNQIKFLHFKNIITEASCFRFCPLLTEHCLLFFLIQEFQKQLTKAQRIMIIGNGGIALELV